MTLIKVISVVLAVLIVLFFVLPVFGFNLIRYISAVPLNTADISQPIDLSTANQYSGFESSYDGMILGRSGGEDNITKILEKRVTAKDCSICFNCVGVDLNKDGSIDTYNCQDCATCNGTTQPNRFKNCINCNATGNCKSCDDTGDEYLLCKEIKKCILEYYGDKDWKDQHGCFIDAISRIAGVTFNIDDLKTVLSSCKDESIKVNIGNNISKELCYFNSTSISYYDFERPSDFYLENRLPQASWPGTWGYVYQGNILMPFYEENGEIFERYRVYVSILGPPNENYTVSVIKAHHEIYGDIIDYRYEVGKIRTDSTGFGYGEFIEFPQDWKDIWKERNEMNGIRLDKVNVGAFSFNTSFIANVPESNGVWSNDLRYSNCNFNTNPEPYLKDRPWWVSNPDNLNSSWFINSGNPNSSIKVYYDPNMFGGKIETSSIRSNIKIQLGRFDPDFSRDCKFDIYICPQDAFAERDGESILSLIDFFTNFNPTNVYKTETDGNNKIILYNYFELNLGKNYTVEEIGSALKTGFRLWEQQGFVSNNIGSALDWLNNNDGIYEGNWYETTGAAEYNSDCWNQNLEDYTKGTTERAIFGNCPADICSGNLKIRIAFKYTKPDKDHPYLHPLYPVITFCSPESTTTAVCGDNVIEGTEKCDGTDFGTPPATCKSRGYQSGTLGCYPAGQPNECTYNTTDCVPYPCGNNVKEPGEACDGTNLTPYTSDCSSYLGYAGGTLKCKSDCTAYDTSGCTSTGPVCGDGKIDLGEQCDGTNLTPYTSDCSSYLGYAGGTLKCKSDCSDYDTSGCTGCTGTSIDECTEDLSCRYGSWSAVSPATVVKDTTKKYNGTASVRCDYSLSPTFQRNLTFTFSGPQGLNCIPQPTIMFKFDFPTPPFGSAADPTTDIKFILTDGKGVSAVKYSNVIPTDMWYTDFWLCNASTFSPPDFLGAGFDWGNVTSITFITSRVSSGSFWVDNMYIH